MNKDYYKITELSVEFQKFAHDLNMPGRLGSPQTDVQLWQAKAMFAIAQQLSIIAGHLGTITKGVKNDQDSATSSKG